MPSYRVKSTAKHGSYFGTYACLREAEAAAKEANIAKKYGASDWKPERKAFDSKEFYKEYRTAAEPFFREAWSKGKDSGGSGDLRILSEAQVRNLLNKYFDKLNAYITNVDRGEFSAGSMYSTGRYGLTRGTGGQYLVVRL